MGSTDKHNQAMEAIRVDIKESDVFDEKIHVTQHKKIDAENDEVYEMRERYKDVALIGVNIDGRDTHVGIRLRLNTILIDALRNQLNRIFEANNKSLSDFEITEVNLNEYIEYQITSEEIT